MHELASQKLFATDAALFSGRIAENRGWVLHKLEYPIIDCEFQEEGKTSLRLKLQCDNWNEEPPSIVLLASDGSILTTLPPNPTNVFNAGPHPSAGRPFVCMKGSREYHTHPSHLSESWDSIKHLPQYNLGGILTQLWRAWQKGI